MSADNPFSAKLGPGFPHGQPPEALPAEQVLAYLAESLWDYLGELPSKPEATLARRKLQETVFWGELAAKPCSAPENGA